MTPDTAGTSRRLSRRAVLTAPALSVALAAACQGPDSGPRGATGSSTSPAPEAPPAPGQPDRRANAPTGPRAASQSSVRLSPYSWRPAEDGHHGSSGAHLAALLRSRRPTLLLDSPGPIAYRVNGGAWQYSAGTAAVPVKMDPSLTWETNLIEAVLVDSWGIFRGFEMEPGASIQGLADDGGPRILALGDSITEGGSVGPDGASHSTNALLAYPAALREVLGAHVGVSASGGRGWLNNNPLVKTWANLDNNRMDFLAPPHAVVIMVGGGEPDDPGLGQAVRSTLNDMLKTLATSHILVLGHTNASSPAVSTINGVARSFADSRVHFVDAAKWIDPSTDTTDGVHHAGFVGRAIMGPRIAHEIRRVLGSHTPVS